MLELEELLLPLRSTTLQPVLHVLFRLLFGALTRLCRLFDGLHRRESRGRPIVLVVRRNEYRHRARGRIGEHLGGGRRDPEPVLRLVYRADRDHLRELDAEINAEICAEVCAEICVEMCAETVG